MTEGQGKEMIGFYNYTVILTFMSLLSAITGITLAHGGNYSGAIICIALSGFFDIFDGKVARTKKDRTADEKLFGIELDSLCDVVAFVTAPAVLCYCMGVDGRIGILAIAIFCICGVMRLGYYNVREINLFFSGGGHTEVYFGMPVTTSAVAFPLAYMFRSMVSENAFILILTFLLFGLGVLFISPFKLKTLGIKQLIGICVGVLVILVVTFIFAEGEVNGLIN